MKRRNIITWAGAAGLFSSVGIADAAGLSEGDAASGVRVALQRGAESAVALLGKPDGFLGNPRVRIPLPAGLDKVASTLKMMGQGKRVDELVTAMNRAAEEAVPAAQELLVDAVKSISVEDAIRIVRGSETSVTDFFVSKTRVPLQGRFLPIVQRATAKVSLADRYNAFASKAAGFGLIKKEDADLDGYVTGKALDGLYLMIGDEEKKIRQDPMATGSAILKKVFGGS